MSSAPSSLMSGTSMVSVSQVAGMLERADARKLKEIFTPAEIRYSSKKRHAAEHFAGRLAAKQAFLSALGRTEKEMPFRNIEVVRKPSGEPALKIRSSEKRNVLPKGSHIHLSMAHERDVAVAFVLIECGRG